MSLSKADSVTSLGSSRKHIIPQKLPQLNLQSENVTPDLFSQVVEDFVDKRIPDFYIQQDQRTEFALKRGRNPKSLPRNSELWHYSKISQQRLDRIKKGCNFWTSVGKSHLIAENELSQSQIPNISKSLSSSSMSLVSDFNYQTLESPTKFVNESSTKYNIDSPSKFINESQMNSSKNSPKNNSEYQVKQFPHKFDSFDQNIFGFGHTKSSSSLEFLNNDKNFKDIEFVKKNPVNFLMPLIIMNDHNEILFVDKFNELRSKPIYKITSADRIRFQILDITSPRNNKGIEYNEDIWIQPLDNGEDVNHIMHTGSILTSKLFLPPELNSMPELYSGVQDSLEEKISDDDGDSDLISPPNSPSQSKKNNKSTSPTNSKEEPTSPPSQQSKQNDETTGNEVKSANDSISIEKKNGQGKLNDISKSHTLCGHLNLSKIVEIRKELNSPHELLSDDKASRFITKQALHLGKFIFRRAVRGNKFSNFLMNGDSIIIQQDQYCLSTAPADEYQYWPPNSGHIIKNSGIISPDLIDEYEETYIKFIIGNGESIKVKKSKQVLNTSKEKKIDETNANSNKDSTHFIESNESDINHGCIRKIISRNPPYEYVAERRCVWKIFLYRQYSHADKKPTKDRIRASAMDYALQNLDNSVKKKNLSLSKSINLNQCSLEEMNENNLKSLSFIQDRRRFELNPKKYFQNRISSDLFESSNYSDFNDSFFSLTSEIQAEQNSPSRPSSKPYSRELSQEIRSIFRSDVGIKNKSNMFLSNPNTISSFDSYTVGERVLALHDTMHTVNKIADVS